MKRPRRFVLVVLETFEHPEENRFPLKARTIPEARKAGERLLSEIVRNYTRWLIKPDHIETVWIEEVKTVAGLEPDRP